MLQYISPHCLYMIKCPNTIVLNKQIYAGLSNANVIPSIFAITKNIRPLRDLLVKHYNNDDIISLLYDYWGKDIFVSLVTSIINNALNDTKVAEKLLTHVDISELQVNWSLLPQLAHISRLPPHQYVVGHINDKSAQYLLDNGNSNDVIKHKCDYLSKPMLESILQLLDTNIDVSSFIHNCILAGCNLTPYRHLDIHCRSVRIIFNYYVDGIVDESCVNIIPDSMWKLPLYKRLFESWKVIYPDKHSTLVGRRKELLWYFRENNLSKLY